MRRAVLNRRRKNFMRHEDRALPTRLCQGLSFRGDARARNKRALFMALYIIASLLLLSCARQESNEAGQPPAEYAQKETTTTTVVASNANANASASPQEQRGELDTSNSETYSHLDENPFLEVARAPLSTFSV